ncbi:cob(I)yrinic acid a,c-diamide adenosyltransferase [Desulfobacula sp.]|uniref:cob(I)yrinic acid a,c-diamide adenosyltransferase n=1 Tax=Desulfobacula sp. TaxID=2593537 RepID=UPI00262397A9|nr:cob(I)yrinic acid a,c-diamide adenosyltransferase [Desulfobacula sp.]
MKKGYIHLYTGNGKGKTTAALGLALRAAGHDFSVYIAQFMKGQPYGEMSSIALIPNITLKQFGDPGCIRKEEVTPKHIFQAQKGMTEFGAIMKQGAYDMLIMDEICVAIWFGLISESQVIHMMQSKPHEVELVLTGRKATQNLIDHADLVTEMKEIKHYYHSLGILARQGIEN